MLRQMLPDVQDGDSLTGINVPQRGVRFYKNGRSIGVVDDGDFARAFFAIWLDARTSEPKLRRQLLGESPCPAGGVRDVPGASWHRNRH